MITIREDENILLTKRRHKFVLFSELFPLVVIFLLTIFFMLFLSIYYSSSDIKEYLGSFSYLSILEIDYYFFIFFLLSIFALTIWQFIFIIFAHFYLDCWIITDERTIHTELRSLFSRFYSSVSHDKIQDITVDIHGIFPTIFKYGDLKIQTAGAFKDFVFSQIPDPYKTKDILFEAYNNKEVNKDKNEIIDNNL